MSEESDLSVYLEGKLPNALSTKEMHQAFLAGSDHAALNRTDIRAFIDSIDAKKLYATVALGTHVFDPMPPPLTEELITLDLVCQLLIDVGNMFDFSEKHGTEWSKALERFTNTRNFLLVGHHLNYLLDVDPDRWPDVESFVQPELIGDFMNRNYFDIRSEKRYFELLMVEPDIALANYQHLLQLIYTLDLA